MPQQLNGRSMSRVTLSASAALVLLLAACGGSSSGDGPTLDDQIDNELADNDGVLDGQIITTPDGTRYVVDAIDPNAGRRFRIPLVRVGPQCSTSTFDAATFGDPYIQVELTGTSLIPGTTWPISRKEGEPFQRLTADSDDARFREQDRPDRQHLQAGDATVEVWTCRDFDPATAVSKASDGGVNISMRPTQKRRRGRLRRRERRERGLFGCLRTPRKRRPRRRRRDGG